MSVRFVCADATLESSYEGLLGAARADLLLTDPPYCLLTRRRRRGDLRESKGRKNDDGPSQRFENVAAYRAFTDRWLGAAVRFLSPEARLVVWTNFLGKGPITDAAARLGYPHLWGEFVWAKKTRESSGNELLLRVYEVALVLARQPLRALESGELARVWSVVAGYDDDGEANRWGAHPNHKPYGVLEPLVRAYSRPGQLVLDPFAGSGSIPAACGLLERGVAAMEKDPGWAKRAGARLSSGP